MNIVNSELTNIIFKNATINNNKPEFLNNEFDNTLIEFKIIHRDHVDEEDHHEYDDDHHHSELNAVYAISEKLTHFENDFTTNLHGQIKTFADFNKPSLAQQTGDLGISDFNIQSYSDFLEWSDGEDEFDLVVTFTSEKYGRISKHLYERIELQLNEVIITPTPFYGQPEIPTRPQLRLIQ